MNNNLFIAFIGFLSAIIGGIISSIIAPFLTKQLELDKKREELILINNINLYSNIYSILSMVFDF